MNPWTKISIELASQKNYLDELYKVYPIISNLRRALPEDKEKNIRAAFKNNDKVELVEQLLDWDLFPIKDSYVAYLKRDKESISRNPQTINRIAENLFQMGIEEIIYRCTEPKETNRQIGPMFKNWINTGALGVPVYKTVSEFLNSEENCIFNSSDIAMEKFAREYLGFTREKGIDFIAKFNNKYVIAETKFLTDFGGHQNAQFSDATSTMHSEIKNKNLENEVIPIAIMDGVLYIKSNNKMYRYLLENPNQIILSSLILKEFLYSL